MRMIVAAVIIVVVLASAAILLRPRIARAELLKEGEIAPPIETQMIAGEQVLPFSLVTYRGRKVILYFYPKDDTPGCTREACAFRDGFARFQQEGLMVVGCSIDSQDAHRAFIRKYNLPFPLLLDPQRKIATAYGAANGIPILGLDRRVTYVISADGYIEKVFPRVDPVTHADQILAQVKPVPTPIPSSTATATATPQPTPKVSRHPSGQDEDSNDDNSDNNPDVQ